VSNRLISTRNFGAVKCVADMQRMSSVTAKSIASLLSGMLMSYWWYVLGQSWWWCD